MHKNELPDSWHLSIDFKDTSDQICTLKEIASIVKLTKPNVIHVVNSSDVNSWFELDIEQSNPILDIPSQPASNLYANNISNVQSTSNKSEFKTKNIVYLLIVGVIGLFLGYIRSDDVVLAVAFALGFVTSVTVICAVIGSLIGGVGSYFANGDFKKLFFNTAYISSALLIGLALLGQYGVKKQAERARFVDKTMSDFETLSSINDNFDEEVDFKFRQIESPETDEQKVTNLLRVRFNESIEIRNAYFKELEECGWSSIFEPERIQRAGSLAETNKIYNRAVQAVKNLRNKNVDSYDQFYEALRNLLPKDRTLTSENYNKGKDLLELATKTEIDVVNALYSVVLHLHSANGEWVYEDEMFYFDKDSDVDEFNSLMEKFNKVTKQQELVLSQIEKANKAELLKLK
tara:strand:- start:417 stop:1628 length:1212 start_codon:yes stop_codon:yes gene_type:complete